MSCSSRLITLSCFTALFLYAASPLTAQDRLKEMPGYKQYEKMRSEIPGSVKLGTLSVTWKDGGKAFEYTKEGKHFRYDIAARKAAEIKEGEAAKEEAAPAGPGRRRGGGGRGAGQSVERGRQSLSSTSPDGKLKAVYKDRNLFITEADGKNEVRVTDDGSEKNRIKYGTASWVYGEELYQNSAMWWSPDSKRLAFYRFDESKVKDFFLQLDQTHIQSKMDTEPYPKSGTDNPVVDLIIYDVEKQKKTTVDVRDGRTFDNSVMGYYVYKIEWSPDGKELLFNRTNRRQNIMEFAAADPESGKCRVIVHEEWLPSWVENSPYKRYLKDNNRFLWISERNGFSNYYLYDLSGKLHATVTNNQFDVVANAAGSPFNRGVIRVDEENGYLYYLAHDGDNYMKEQLHRVGLDGKGDKRLTDPKYHHTVNLAPDGKHFIDTIQTHDTPPATMLVDGDGKVIEELNNSDTTKFDKLGLKKTELLTFKAGDGETELHGILHFPSNFDPQKKYPLLVSVYAGPATNGARESFSTPNPMTEYGFLYANFDARSAAGRGKKILDSIYLKLGVTEIDDLAAGVKSLWSRPYLNKDRVGIFGTSYGGYASCMAILRHPDVFHAACGASSVTSWYHYDTIYTERYMWIPQENKDGYEKGSAMNYAKDLKGRLMMYYGTADNNVHPNNAMQLIQALQRAGKSFEVQVGPDQGHSGINQQRMMEFFIESLVMKP